MSTVDSHSLNKMKYIDGITIIDSAGTILFTVKFNPRFHSEMKEADEIIGKHLFAAFPNINEETSTLMEVIKTGRPVYLGAQDIIDFRGRQTETSNISLPIKAGGEIIGAIELSMDIISDEAIHDNVIPLNFDMFQNDHFLKGKIKPEQAFYTFDDIISFDKQMNELKHLSKKTAKSTSAVFIFGETGTGKELFAQAIHNASDRADRPFIAQNCGAIPDSLIESILFGTKKGSFTGSEDRPGLFELADGGTLFLDEINSMPIQVQSKLLRVLQDGNVRRLGDTKTQKIDVRIITASNKDPKDCVRDGEMRLDLYYRLCVIMLHIPALRDRKNDIETLFHFFINKFNMKLNRSIRHVSKEVYEFLLDYSWPGNVRELENMAEFALNQTEEWENTLKFKHIENKIKHLIGNREVESGYIPPLKAEVAKLEKKLMIKALKKTNGNVSQAAKILEIPRQTLQSKINAYRIFE